MGGGLPEPTGERNLGGVGEVISPMKLIYDSGSRAVRIQVSNRLIECIQLFREQMVLNGGCGWGRGRKETLRLALPLQFSLLMEMSKAKITGNRWPGGSGAHPSTLPPSLILPWAHSKTGQIPLSVH